MEKNLFYDILDKYEEECEINESMGDYSESGGLCITYKNANGEIKKFSFRNIRPSVKFGDDYIDGMPLSDYRYDRMLEETGAEDCFDAATTSMKTLKIERIISVGGYSDSDSLYDSEPYDSFGEELECGSSEWAEAMEAYMC